MEEQLILATDLRGLRASGRGESVHRAPPHFFAGGFAVTIFRGDIRVIRADPRQKALNWTGDEE
jgi:hypothetical protein